ncbi:hypothetical protein ACIRG5_00875 [Lentzea sp. NPDC102401]|uniref:hypothetical protein n=1 Tax=Lentzea sp. NPDC102401 TaxID=3364128 RepID=UPI003800949A
MGFTGQARRVRDRRFAHGQRVAALCSCVSRHHPIGHRATLSFLAELAGPLELGVHRAWRTGHWYATDSALSRRAALHALKLWEHEPDTVDDEVRSLVRSCVANGRLTGEQLTIALSRRDEGEDVRWPMTLIASANGMSPTACPRP